MVCAQFELALFNSQNLLSNVPPMAFLAVIGTSVVVNPGVRLATESVRLLRRWLHFDSEQHGIRALVGRIMIFANECILNRYLSRSQLICPGIPW